MIIIEVVLFLITLVIRSIGSYLFKYKNFDSYGHENIINLIRDQGIHNLTDSKRYVLPSTYNYPCFVHWLLSFVSKKYQYVILKYFNPILDSLFTLFIFNLFYVITNSIITSLYGSILYLFMPIFFTIFKDGPRIASFTPRLFGEILTSIVFIIEYYYFVSNNYTYYLFAIFLGSFIFLSSKFSLQVFLFTNLFLSAFLFNYEYILVVIISYFLALIFSKGIYFKIFINQIMHLYRYYFLMKDKKVHYSDRNNLKKAYAFLLNLDFHSLVNYLRSNVSFSIILIQFPIYYISLFLSIKSIFTNHGDFVDFIIIINFIIVIITSLKRFIFLGVAERYTIYIYFFIFLKLIDFENLWVIVFFSFSLFLYHMVQELSSLKNLQSNNKDEIVYNWLNKQKTVLNVATFPVHLGGYGIVTRTQHNFLFWAFWNKKNIEEIDNFIKYNPYFDFEKIDILMQKYKIDYLIVDAIHAKNVYGTKRFFNNDDIESIGNNIFVVKNRKTSEKI